MRIHLASYFLSKLKPAGISNASVLSPSASDSTGTGSPPPPPSSRAHHASQQHRTYRSAKNSWEPRQALEGTKDRGGWITGEGGGGGQGVRTVLEEGKQTTQKEDTDEEREEVRVRCQPHSCKQLQSKDP